jgi:iron complex outermembrane receptor protein
MKTTTSILVFFALVFAGLPLWAQNKGTIQGTVTDQTGEAMPAVNIVLAGTTKGAFTDKHGDFKITGINSGHYRVKATFIGYAPFQSQLLNIRAGQTTSVNITLKKATRKGQQIVITGTKQPEKLLKSPATIDQISSAEISHSGGVNFMSSLSMAKGLNFTDAGVNTQLVSARGFNSSFNTRMLFLIDGRLATLGGTGLPQGNFLPQSKLDIKKMEVVLGPSAALYGPNSGSGVINVITKDPWDQSGITISGRLGNQELRNINYRIAGTVNNKFGWKITGQFKHAVDFKPRRSDSLNFYQAPGTKPTPANTVFETDVVKNYNVGATKVNGALYYKFGSYQITGSYGYSSTSQFSLTANGRNRIHNWKVNYQDLRFNGPHWYAQVTRNGNTAGSFQLNQLVPLVQKLVNAGQPINQIDLGSLRDQLAFVDNTTIYDSEVQYNNTFGGLSLVAGFNYRNFQPESKGTYLDDGDGKSISRQLYGGYLQLSGDLVPNKLRGIAAARLDGNSDYDTQLSPKAALVYTVVPGQNIRFTFNRAYTSPTILQSHALIPADLSAQVPGYALLIKGNTEGYTIKDAKGNVVNSIDPTVPEIVNSIELGYKGSIQKKLFIDAVAYYGWHHNFIGVSAVADGFKKIAYQNEQKVLAPDSKYTLLETYINFGKATVRGFNIGLNYHFTPNYKLGGSISGIKLVNFTNDVNDTKLPLNTPPIKFKLHFEAQNFFNSSALRSPFIKLNSRWQQSYEYLSGYWNSDVLLDNDDNITDKAELPSKFQLDASLGFDIAQTGLSLQGSVTNITNTDHVDILGSPPIGRMYWIRLKYNFNGFRF